MTRETQAEPSKTERRLKEAVAEARSMQRDFHHGHQFKTVEPLLNLYREILVEVTGTQAALENWQPRLIDEPVGTKVALHDLQRQAKETQGKLEKLEYRHFGAADSAESAAQMSSLSFRLSRTGFRLGIKSAALAGAGTLAPAAGGFSLPPGVVADVVQVVVQSGPALASVGTFGVFVGLTVMLPRAMSRAHGVVSRGFRDHYKWQLQEQARQLQLEKKELTTEVERVSSLQAEFKGALKQLEFIFGSLVSNPNSHVVDNELRAEIALELGAPPARRQNPAWRQWAHLATIGTVTPSLQSNSKLRFRVPLYEEDALLSYKSAIGEMADRGRAITDVGASSLSGPAANAVARNLD